MRTAGVVNVAQMDSDKRFLSVQITDSKGARAMMKTILSGFFRRRNDLRIQKNNNNKPIVFMNQIRRNL